MTVNTIDTEYAAHVATLSERFARALDGIADGAVIHSGSGHVAFLDDRHYPFIPNPHYKNWIPGPHTEDCLLVIRPGQRPQLLFHQPDDYWYQPPEDPSGFWTGEFDIEVVRSLDAISNLLGDASKLAYIGEHPDAAAAWGLRRQNPESLLAALHYDRAYKTRYELGCMREANRVAAAGHIAAKDAFEAGASEFEIQASYLAATAHREHETPYGSIVALNEHAAVLHYQHYDVARLQADELRTLLIDAGATCQGYAADVTRTYTRGDGPFAVLIDAMKTEQQGIIDEIAPGSSYADLHLSMQRRIANVLTDAGLLNMDADDAVEHGVTFTFMPHGLGHLLGAQTHDVAGQQTDTRGTHEPPPAGHPALRLTRPIDEGMVFTIEPGLYFIPSLLSELRAGEYAHAVNWTAVEAMIPYGGIRIEDNIAIVDGATENLTQPHLPL